MEDLLDKVIEELGYDPLLCVKYVDDLFLIVPKEELENTLPTGFEPRSYRSMYIMNLLAMLPL
jgi:hypothetical protein